MGRLNNCRFGKKWDKLNKKIDLQEKLLNFIKNTCKVEKNMIKFGLHKVKLILYIYSNLDHTIFLSVNVFKRKEKA